MDEKEKKIWQDILKKLRESSRAAETPEQAMDNFERYMKDTVNMPSKLRKMQEKVKEELEHIPDCPEHQNELRLIYWDSRMHSLGKKATSKQTAKEVLEGCISRLENDYPNYQFLYDEDFFNKCG